MSSAGDCGSSPATAGGTSTYWKERLQSSGSGTVELESIEVDAPFSVQPRPTPADPINLPPGSYLDIEVTLSSSGDSYGGDLVMSSRSQSRTVQVSANRPCLEVVGPGGEPGVYDMGEVPIGGEKTVIAAVRNCGVPVSGIHYAMADHRNDDFEIVMPQAPFELRRGESRDVTVTFRPLTIEVSSAEVTFEDGAGAAGMRFLGRGTQ